MKTKLSRIHVVSHTHWDREWYQDFQSFRVRLTYMMDELIGNMESDPKYLFFMLDGQTILLDDYLEIRPENRNRLETLIKNGRISIGPWYVMPDEFLVSGEALIRNLQKGMRQSRSWGMEPMKSGYIVDMFGHNSQMPQIFRGFGIDNAVLFRGFHGDGDPAEIWWEGADGSRVLGLKLDEDRCYSDFYFALRWPFFDRDRAYEEHREELVERAVKLMAYKCARSTASVGLSLDGVDHIEMEPHVPLILNILNKSDKLDTEFIHSTIEAYLEELRKEPLELKVYKGEQSTQGYNGLNNWMPENTLSSRIHLKQMNHECETLLEKWAEPLAVMAGLEGRLYPKAFLNKAWEYLLQNHPHDSICGCSIDQVHRDMLYRFDQSRLIAGQMIKEQASYIVNHLSEEALKGAQALVVFNPAPYELDQIIEAELDLPIHTDVAVSWKGLNLQGTSFRLFDKDDKEIPYQVLGIEQNRASMHRPYGELPRYEPVDRFRIAFSAQVPALGYTAYRLDPYTISPEAPLEYNAKKLVAPIRHLGSMQVAEHTWNNGRIVLYVHRNGTIDLTDLETGSKYEGLLLFEDEADAGDGWSHVPPATNEKVTSHGAEAIISMVFDGPFQTRIRIQSKLVLPRSLSPDENSRSSEYTEVQVTTLIDLKKDDPIVYCRTMIKNTARDHRLLLLFPAVPDAEHYYTSTPFDLVKRNVRKHDYSAYVRKPLEVVPHNGLIAVEEGGNGLAVMSRGLYEASVRDKEKRTIALTLFRSTSKEVMEDGGNGGQLLRELDFRYAIRPFDPRVCDKARLWREQQQFVSGVRTMGRKAGKRFSETPHKREANLPAAKSYLELSSQEFVLSAFKEAEDEAGCWIIRLVNVTEREGQGRLTFGRDISKVEWVELDETVISVLHADKQAVQISGAAKKIVTVKIRFA
ncbi:alpha-mannosidase [Cohnella silvisoli]|uniref:Glycoside hydrolase family 38 C-terminal domain-containing protein n=1 Tax=Cohnella silvisoli TaxID=2873699 RepID=A0ABV1KLR7_9BACL|nr:glycoside hydrolase family 38 C-terminal domain-containing protein [Cohnella silvisoli]MCD9020620.1 hypothetical protein [Cohnella silvisoli]